MNSEKIVVKNEPVFVYKPFGRPIRSVKRPSAQQSKSLRQSKRVSIKSEPKEVQVKQEPSTDAEDQSSDDESSTESSHKCKICKMRFANLRSLNKHARIHSDQEDNNSDIESKEAENENEESTDTDDESSTESSHKCKICKMRFVNLRSLNKHARHHSDQEEKKSDIEPNQPVLKASMAFLRQIEPAQPEEQVEPQMADNQMSEKESKRAKKKK